MSSVKHAQHVNLNQFSICSMVFVRISSESLFSQICFCIVTCRVALFIFQLFVMCLHKIHRSSRFRKHIVNLSMSYSRCFRNVFSSLSCNFNQELLIYNISKGLTIKFIISNTHIFLRRSISYLCVFVGNQQLGLQICKDLF